MFAVIFAETTDGNLERPFIYTADTQEHAEQILQKNVDEWLDNSGMLDEPAENIIYAALKDKFDIIDVIHDEAHIAYENHEARWTIQKV